MEDAVGTATISDPAALQERIREVRGRLGSRVLLLGHHYQVDEVIRFADFTGDSFKLARLAADHADAEFIVFCGVHFMAESADILTAPHQTVLLPDLAAGCSMADMANLDQVETAWVELTAGGRDDLLPVTYMNSSAAIKAFCGRHGGLVCTSSNAEKVLAWAWERKRRVLFLPDQHLGRNVAFEMGVPLAAMALWDPHATPEENATEGCADARLILWKGHCSVHTKFLPQHVDAARAQHPGIRVMSHPECIFDVVRKSDAWGSTEKIIRAVEMSPAGSKWAIGTEFNLVSRLAREHPDKTVVSLSGINCLCSTMYRIDPAHLLRTLEGIESGDPLHPIRVPTSTARDALLALERMLSLAA